MKIGSFLFLQGTDEQKAAGKRIVSEWLEKNEKERAIKKAAFVPPELATLANFGFDTAENDPSKVCPIPRGAAAGRADRFGQ